MPETPRSSFRLPLHTLRRIEEIRQHYRTMNRYDRATKTDVIERAVDELHRWLITSASTSNPGTRP
jgi:hypothetical protein